MRRPRFGTILGLMAAVALIAMWLYLFVLADPDVLDELDDPAFAQAAEPVCARTQEQITDISAGADPASPEERGELVAAANDELAAMVAQLEELAPTEGDDARLVELWLADWATYLDDRDAYADQLLDGEDVELLITARGTDQITVTVDRFAQVNDMPACQVPLDV